MMVQWGLYWRLCNSMSQMVFGVLLVQKTGRTGIICMKSQYIIQLHHKLRNVWLMILMLEGKCILITS